MMDAYAPTAGLTRLRARRAWSHHTGLSNRLDNPPSNRGHAVMAAGASHPGRSTCPDLPRRDTRWDDTARDAKDTTVMACPDATHSTTDPAPFRPAGGKVSPSRAAGARPLQARGLAAHSVADPPRTGDDAIAADATAPAYGPTIGRPLFRAPSSLIRCAGLPDNLSKFPVLFPCSSPRSARAGTRQTLALKDLFPCQDHRFEPWGRDPAGRAAGEDRRSRHMQPGASYE